MIVISAVNSYIYREYGVPVTRELVRPCQNEKEIIVWQIDNEFGQFPRNKYCYLYPSNLPKEKATVTPLSVTGCNSLLCRDRELLFAFIHHFRQQDTTFI
ncbi:beta-galactosidase [Halobacillus amylolyticus]|uniref:beta-galactosidase n=1 Tax=Halobacillus amylolyticus TaxID=2932259 RepID=UPI0037C051DF